MTWEGLITRLQELVNQGHYTQETITELEKIYAQDPERAIQAARLLIEIAEYREERKKYKPGTNEYTVVSHKITDRRRKLEQMGLLYLDTYNPKSKRRTNGTKTTNSAPVTGPESSNGVDMVQARAAATVLVQGREVTQVRTVSFDEIVRAVSAIANYLFRSDPPPYMCVPVEVIADMLDIAPRHIRDVIEDPKLDGRIIWTPFASHICIRPNVENVLIDESRLSRQLRLLLRKRDDLLPWRETRQILMECLDNPVYCREELEGEKRDKIVQALKSMAIALTLLPDLMHPEAVPDIDIMDDGKLVARWGILGLELIVEKVGTELMFKMRTDMQLV